MSESERRAYAQGLSAAADICAEMKRGETSLYELAIRKEAVRHILKMHESVNTR